MNVKNVAFFAEIYPPKTAASGLVTYVDTMRAGLRELGVSSRVLAFETDGAADDVVRADLPRPARRAMRLAQRVVGGGGLEWQAAIAATLFRLEQKTPVEIFEIEEHAGLGRLVQLAPLRARVVVRLHGPHFLVAGANGIAWDHEAKATDKAERVMCASAVALSAPSRDVLSRVRDTWQLPFENAVVIPNPSPEIADEQAWLGDLKGPLVFVGRFDRTKGADLVVRAFRELAPKHPELELWMVGPDAGLLENGVKVDAPVFVEREIEDPSVRARIKLLGKRTPEEVAEIRRKASLVLVASRYETFCLAAVEAMMAGCPVIAPRSGALPEIITDHETGLLFDAGDAHDLAKVIDGALAAPAHLRDVAKRGRERARAEYAPRVVARRMIDFYGSVSERSRFLRRR